MISQPVATKTYKISLATEVQATYNNKRLLISLVFHDGRKHCTVLPLRTDCTTETEVNTAINYALPFTPRVDRETGVEIYHSYHGSIDLPYAHREVTVISIPARENPATAPLQHYIRNLAPMI
jgi:hypothetical protein